MTSRVSTAFDRFARRCSELSGRAATFALAVAVLVVWAITGPLFGFSDTWQLIINTGTTIVTFLMVFLLQHTQNKDSHAIQIKLDELIAATHRARNRMLDVEEMADDEIEAMQAEFQQLARKSPRIRRKAKGTQASGRPART